MLSWLLGSGQSGRILAFAAADFSKCMAHQRKSVFSTTQGPSTAARASETAPQMSGQGSHRAGCWSSRSSVVILRLYVGALVVLLPWRSVWTTMHGSTTAHHSAASWLTAGCAASSPASACSISGSPSASLFHRNIASDSQCLINDRSPRICASRLRESRLPKQPRWPHHPHHRRVRRTPRPFSP